VADAAAVLECRVPRDGTVGNHQCAFIVADAAVVLECRVPRDGAVGNHQRASVVGDTAAEFCRAPGAAAVGNRKVFNTKDRASKSQSISPGQGQATDLHRDQRLGTVIDVENPGAVVAIDCQIGRTQAADL